MDWSTGRWNHVDKHVTLYGPHGFTAEIDFDDVDHDTVESIGKEMVSVLNTHWPAGFDAKLAEQLARRDATEEAANG